MRHVTAILALLPALALGHPFQARNTASTEISENDGPTSSTSEYTSSTSEYTSSSTSEYTSSTSEYTSSTSEYTTSTSEYTTSTSASTTEAPECTHYPSCGAVSHDGSASSTTAAEGAQPTCQLNSWDTPGMATIRLGSVHLKWGPPDDNTVKNQYGPADWFNFPFWCSETEFTVYAFDDNTPSDKMGDTSLCTAQKTCKLSGFSLHGDVPAVQLDITNKEPYVQATDLSGAGDVSIDVDCGPMRPKDSGPLSSAATSSLSQWTSSSATDAEPTSAGANYAESSVVTTETTGSSTTSEPESTSSSSLSSSSSSSSSSSTSINRATESLYTYTGDGSSTATEASSTTEASTTEASTTAEPTSSSAEETSSS